MPRSALISTINLTLLGLAACTTKAVYLRHSGTGKVVQCGPYKYSPYSTMAAQRESQCIEDYKQQSYRRVPSP